MSIARAIADLEAAHEIFPYRPPYTRASPRRCAYLTKEAVKDFNDPQSAVNLLCGPAYIAGALTRWVSGGLVYGDQRRGRFLVMLEPPPPDVWEVRVTEPSTQARLLGRFAAPDTLVLMRFHTRRFLGDKGSVAWNAAMAECEVQWNALFPGISPFSAPSIHAYITENCDDFPLLKPVTPARPRSRRIRGRSAS
jgi:hypothetical protein